MRISPLINQSYASSHDRFNYRFSSVPLTPLPKISAGDPQEQRKVMIAKKHCK
ncbi:MAG: hypothetical protein JXR56_05350 [Candidatus Cloacimonetes bacterium]|nr:hypothetical protein [Candidatus Cloacimonadota bacterium]